MLNRSTLLGKFKRVVVRPLLMLALFPVFQSQAQTSVTFDQQYWFAAPYTASAYWSGTAFRISAFDDPATVTIGIPLNGLFVPKTVTVPAGSTQSVFLTAAEIGQVINTSGNGIMPTGILIETDAKISVYYEAGGTEQSPDLVPLKGSQALGTAFMVPMQQESNVRNDDDPAGQQGFIVLATEDNTQVTITPKAAITGRAAGVPFTITLNRGETYFGQTPGTAPGVSGTTVNSDKPVAVTIFAELMQYGSGPADLGSEQLVPVSNLGTEYLVVRGYRNSTDIVYFTAVEDNTQLLVNGALAATLNATDTYELQTNATNAYHVVANKVVTALQLSGIEYEESFSLLPPLSTCSGSNLVSVVRANDGAFYLNIVAPVNTGFEVNGDAALLAPAAFTSVGGTSWYYARVEVPTALVAAGAPVVVTNTDASVKFQMGVFHVNPGGARYGYFSSYSGITINFNQSASRLCEGGVVTFTPSVLATDPVISYSWTGPGGFPSSEADLVLENVTTAQAGEYILEVTTASCTEQASVNLAVDERPDAPVSGGDQFVCAADPIQTLTASVTHPADVKITWYDAPAGGNVVTDPSLSSVGTVTYYAEARTNNCTSLTRTPVSLSIQASPVLDPVGDQVVCGSYTLPAITGANLSGTEAYFTAPGGTGTRYAPGEVISTAGLTQLYIYDETAAVANCAGQLVVVPNTSMTEADVHHAVELVGENHFLYDGTVNPAFWEGTGTQPISNRAGLPSMVYMSTIGDISLGSPADCFGSEVSIDISVDITNESANDAWGYSGRVSLIDKTTMTELQATQINSNFAAGTTQTISILATVSRADLEAGNIAVLIAVETDQTGLEKNWTLSNFQGAFEFIPATTLGCSDEESFTVTVNEVPDAPVSGGNQYVCAQDPVQTLTATATAPAGSTVVWYDAPAGGNVVTDPSLSTVGSVTYYAESSSGGCSSSSRTPVSLVIEAGPDIDPLDDQVACGAYELPAITGTDLSGNEAYFTGPGGTGTRYEPGDLITAAGANQLYIYDKAAAVANCTGSLDASANTTLPPDHPLYSTAFPPYPGTITPAFWEGTADQIIQYPVQQFNQLYHTIVGDLSLGNTADCFGTEVRVSAAVTVENQGPDRGAGFPGRIAIINKVSGDVLYGTNFLFDFPVGTIERYTVTGVVSLADLSAGNIGIAISLETTHANLVKNWKLSAFTADYTFIPENSVGCADEETFTVTIGAALPAPISGGDQEETASGQILTATALLPAGAPAGSSIVWYDAPTGGNVVADPSLSTNGSVTYYAEIQSDDCRGPRTPVTLTLTPLIPEVCGNGIDDDGNGVADCDDPACNPYANYFANGSVERYTQCPDMSGSGSMQYAVSWKTSSPGDGGQLLVNDPISGCRAPRPIASWNGSTNLPSGSDGLAWAGMHGGAANQPFENFQNTLVTPLAPGSYTFTFSAGYLNAAPQPYQHPGYFRFYGLQPGEADFSTAHLLGNSPMINNLMTANNPEWKEYSFSFTSTQTYDRILIVAYSGPAGVSYMVFDDFSMSFNTPEIALQNVLESCVENAVLEVTNPDPVWTSYQWYLDGAPIAGANGAIYEPAAGQSGTYTVSGVTNEGCFTASSPGIPVSDECPVPFVCNGSAYLVSTPSGGVPSTLSIVAANNPKNVFATLTPSIPGAYNAIGYNFEDNLIYGIVNSPDDPGIVNEIVQIDGQGTVRRLGTPTSTQAGRGMEVWTTDASVNPNGARINGAPGVVGLDNKFYAMVQANGSGMHLATVDLTTMTYTTIPLSADFLSADLAFSPYDGMLYGLAGANRLVRTNPATGEQQVVTPTSGTPPAAGAGGAWNDVQGRVYFYANGGTPAQGAQRLYRYNPANGAFVNVTNVDPFPGFDATACFPTSLEKTVIMPAGGINPGDVVQFQFSIYNNQMLPMTYDFEDILTSSDLSWVADAVNPATPGGGAVNISGQTINISGITVPPSAANGPLTFTVSVKVADNAVYESCYVNQATITQGGVTILSDDPATTAEDDATGFCLNPCTVMLTVGKLTCDPADGTYSVSYISNGDIASTAGTVDVANSMITGIPLGTDITITSSCSGSSVMEQVTGLTTCPEDCVLPDLMLGQPLCGTGNTYTVSYTESTGAAITVTGGTNNGDGTITGTIGTNIKVTASNGNCTSTLTVSSPVGCDIPCKNPAISIGGTQCSSDGSPTYEVVFTVLPDAEVESDQGTVDIVNGIITGIPLGTPATLTISYQTCPDRVITIPSANCNRDFTTSKTVTDASADGNAQAGEELTYTISIENTGDVDLTGITIADVIPAGTTYLDGSADNGGVYDATADRLDWTVDIPFGATLNVSFKVTVSENLTGVTEIANKATVTDPVDPGNPKEPETPPVPTDPVRDFDSEKTVVDASADGNAQAGEELTYTISIENTGDVDLTGITIADVIPAGTTYLDGSAGNGGVYDATADRLDWTVDIPFGATLNVSFKVTVSENLTGVTEIANKATVTDPDDPDHPEEPESPPVPTDLTRDFDSEKIVEDANGDGKAQAGEELTYTISIENTGNVDLTGVSISDPIPAGTSYIAGSATAGGVFSEADDRLDWTVDVPFGETLDIVFKVKVSDNLTGITVVANKATVSDPENPDKTEEPETPPVPADVIRDYETSKTVADATGDGNARAGEELTYAITIENTGNVDLTGFVITDAVPENTEYVEGSADNGGTFENNGLSWTVDIPFGESMSVSFKVTVAGNLTGIDQIANTAAVTDPENPDDPREPSSPELPTFIPDPIANDDDGEVETGDETIIGLVENDETDGSPLDPSTIEVIDPPLHGTIILNPDGTVTYTPDRDYAGIDNFTYRIQDEDGNWSNVATVNITVVPRPLSIPNLFTPNGDGRNDTFVIPGLEGFPDNELFIVNRWGNEVFRQRNYKNTWTGEGLNEGTYYYVLTFRNAAGEEEVYKGYITLVRTFAR